MHFLALAPNSSHAAPRGGRVLAGISGGSTAHPRCSARAIVGGLRELPSVQLAELPRMADYATWGEAVGRALGREPGSFLSTYLDNRKEATLTDLLDSPVGKVLLKVTRHKPTVSGSPAALYSKLTQIVGKQVAGSAGWPKTSEKFGEELRRLAPQLRVHGIDVTFERRHEGRIITLTAEPRARSED